MEELGEKYNHFMQDAILVFVDEVQIKALGNEKGVMAKVKNFITEEFVPIRAMHANAVEQRNFTCWIFMSNMSDPVPIDKGDRRMNVGKYQTTKLAITDDEIEKIDRELQAFHDYLMSFVVDAALVRQVIQSEDRDNMIAISESSIDTVSSALLEGRFEWFLDQLPTDTSYQRNAMRANKADAYKETLRKLMIRTHPDGKCNIHREELQVIYDYVIGNVPDSPNKFTSLLKHHRVHMRKVWVDNRTVNGIQTAWADLSEFPKYTAAYFPAPKKDKAK
jgi:hypothetical protein